MIETFRKIWKFSEKRHTEFLTALLFTFLRTSLNICELLAIITTMKAIFGVYAVKEGIIRILILTIICILGNFFASYMEQKSTMKTGFFMIADKRVSIANLLRKLPLGFFNDNSSGKITSTLTTTLSGVENGAVMIMIGIISGLFSSAVMFVFMMFYDFRIGLITLFGIITYLIVVSLQIKLSRKNAPKLQNAQSTLAESALNFISGIKVTKSFSYRNGDKKLKNAIDGSCKENIALTKKSMPTQFAANLCIAIFESCILIASICFFFILKDIDVVKTIFLLIFSFFAFSSLHQAGSMLSMIGLLDSGIDECESIFNHETLEIKTPLQEPTSNRIEFENVSFSYGKNQVLSNVSVAFEENSLNAIIGPSGSGKTTLCQLIPRFRDVNKGTIKIGGADVKYIDEKILMSKISMVFQNVYLFEDTILNNIRFGNPNATIEQVTNAAKAACCDEFINSLEDGYNTILKEGGSGLSGGEKQRISIARAILKDAPIVILDEATSALDAENETEIISAIEALTKNKTVIMIAHRIKTIQNADKIIALKNGKIVQEGTHSSLCCEEGLYKDFLDSRKKAAKWKITK